MKDGRGVVVITEQPGTPASGPTAKLHLVGELAVMTGEGEKTAEQADVPLMAQTKITIGPLPFVVKPGLVNQFQTEVTFVLEEPIGRIKKIQLLDGEGKEIGQQLMHWENFTVGTKFYFCTLGGQGDRVFQ